MQKPLLDPFSPSSPHSAKERWICIYPCYMNNRRTRAEGRKLSAEQSVENPKHAEVTFVLGKLSLEHILENKVHPREKDVFDFNRWRIRVHLKNDDGSPIDEKFPDRHSLLLYVSKAVSAMRKRGNSNPAGVNPNEQGRKGKKKRK